MGTVINAYSQSGSDLFILDENAEGIDQVRAGFAPGSKVFEPTGFAPNAVQQMTEFMKGLEMKDLHVYALTKPGAIVFNSISVTTNNLDEWSGDLKEWGKHVNGKVFIHSEVVFSGEEGLQLKQSLEEITGLVFTMGF
jgi:hypothetical protein